VRIDYRLSNTHSVYGRFVNDTIPSEEPFGEIFGTNNAAFPGIANTKTDTPGRSFVGTWNWTLGPRAMTEFSYNYSRGGILSQITGNAAREALAGQASVLDAALTVGLSGPGRLHDLVVTLDAMTPGEIKAQGLGITFRYGFSNTPFGRALFAETSRGLSHLAFVEPNGDADAVAELRAAAPRATFERDDDAARALATRIWSSDRPSAPLQINIAGTNFQLKVWQALLRLAARERTSYGEIANEIGIPGSTRAVGSAVGANPVAFLIPCHHVLRKGGALGGYRWGEDRKRAMLAWEALSSAQQEPRRTSRVQATERTALET
jgi:AraC family transcriptional regulator of adaptative response/methylated-DNA-[protein]-cysteine methyltransferase